MVLAAIVLYNPDLERLKENVEAIQDQVDGVLFVDNNSHNLEQVKQMVQKYEMKITHILKNYENTGLTVATNQSVQWGKEHGYDWVLTMNQDSVCGEHLIEHYKKYMDQEKIGAMTCNIHDRNFVEDQNFKDGGEFCYVDTCITSGMLVNSDAFLEVGGYDEKLFMDYSDFEICCNLRKHGYKILQVNYDGLLHEVGNGKNVRILWKRYIAFNQPPMRRYYMARNEIYLARKYSEYQSLAHVMLRQLVQLVIVTLYEKERRKKIPAMFKGIKHGLTMPLYDN